MERHCNSSMMRPAIDIKRIEFTTTGCLGECPVFTLIIYPDCSAYYHAKYFNLLEGEFTGKINVKTLNALMKALATVNFSALHPNPDLYVTCQQGSTLTITYGDDHQEIVDDDGNLVLLGEEGYVHPKQLVRIQVMLSKLRNKVKWTPLPAR